MKRLAIYWSVFTTAARIGFVDFFTIYTWKSWLFGWFLRLICQVAFFTSFGLLLGSHARERYIATGNVVVIACIEALAVVILTVAERSSGTLALQVAAPVNTVASYISRSVCCPAMGIFSSTLAFLIISAWLGLTLPFPRSIFVPVLIAVVAFSAYSFGLALGSIVMRLPSLQWLAVNISYLTLMTFCGVNVPVFYWPPPIRSVTQFLPLTHGLEAIRGLLAGAPAHAVWKGALLEALVGSGWLLLGAFSLTYAIRSSRRRGTIDLAS
jgi:ABC-2 type transport system permease protein